MLQPAAGGGALAVPFLQPAADIPYCLPVATPVAAAVVQDRLPESQLAVPPAAVPPLVVVWDEAILAPAPAAETD